MKSFLPLSFCLIATISTGTALAQTSTVQTSENTEKASSPVAYVYVSRPTHIDGFAASSSGALTPVPGSPLANTSAGRLSVTKKFLFGLGDDSFLVSTFSISSKGSLKKVSSLNISKYETGVSPACVDYPDMQVDFAQSALYVQENWDCAAQGYEPYLTFHIESNGDLQFLGHSGGQLDDNIQVNIYLTTAGTDKFAYDGLCEEDNGNLSVIDIYKRESNGLLTYIGQDNQTPAGENGKQYCAGILAADSENHLAVALQRIDGQGGDDGPLNGPTFLATYTENSNGSLSTKSTWENMPEALVGDDSGVTAMSVSPGNKFLAVSGYGGGFQIFHFNGSDPITKYSGVLQSGVQFFQQFGWDKANHLYALGGGKLFVYTVTSSEIKQAPGSPYSIPESSSVSVLSLE
jgi:hypothetical protein